MNMNSSSMLSSDILETLTNSNVFVFDFDGTISGTEACHFKAYALQVENVGGDSKKMNSSKYMGFPEQTIYHKIKEDLNIEFDDAAFFESRMKIYLDLVDASNLQPYKYFAFLLENFKDKEFVILSSQKAYILDILIQKWGLQDVFSKIISVGDLDITKLDGIYQIIKNNKKEDIVWFEDSNHALELGKNLGIKTIGIQHDLNQIDEELCTHIIIA